MLTSMGRSGYSSATTSEPAYSAEAVSTVMLRKTVQPEK